MNPSQTVKPDTPSWRTPLMILLAGCVISLVGFGLRSTFGLFTDPLSEAHGWGRDIFSFAIAIQNLLWGATQPFVGAIADRYGTGKVLALGAVLYAIGVALMAVVETEAGLYVSGGILVGLGLSGTSFTLVIAAFARMMPAEKRSWALGLVPAAGSFGQFVFAPVGQSFIAAYGWQTALLLLTSSVMLVPIMALAVAGKPQNSHSEAETDLAVWEAVKTAARHRSYQLLIAGFFVCGFHIAFITTHLPAYLSDHGVDGEVAGWAIALIGLFNIIGSYTAGVLGGRHSKRMILSAIYASRAVAIVLFIALPTSSTSVLIFSAVMGLLWLSTVPPTSGLVALMFGTRHMATLFGIVFFSHQVGAFLGVWLGGDLYELYGNYDMVWWLSIALGFFAALVHWPIREEASADFFRSQEHMAKP